MAFPVFGGVVLRALFETLVGIVHLSHLKVGFVDTGDPNVISETFNSKIELISFFKKKKIHIIEFFPFQLRKQFLL